MHLIQALKDINTEMTEIGSSRSRYRSRVIRKHRSLHCFVLSLEPRLSQAFDCLQHLKFYLFDVPFAYSSESWLRIVVSRDFYSQGLSGFTRSRINGNGTYRYQQESPNLLSGFTRSRINGNLVMRDCSGAAIPVTLWLHSKSN